MCGIFGVGRIGQSYDDINQTRTRFDLNLKLSLKHRGPDGDGIFQDDKIDLLHMRLSIVDMSSNATQPFVNENNQVVAAVNGEIYNHQELRNTIKGDGRRFISKCDCEVVPVGYTYYGIDVLKELNGMYAGIIYDKLNKKLILFRDYMGKKPLYYIMDEKRVIFCSEIKGILSYLNERPNIDRTALWFFTKLRYIPAPYTMWSGIKKVRPAEAVEIDLVSGNILTKSNFCGSNVLVKASNGNHHHNTEEILSQAIEERLMADVPVGCLLSGGIDSGLIAALSSYRCGYKLNCFSLKGKGRNTSNESEIAKLTAKKYGHYFTEVEVPKGEIILSIFEKLCRKLDQPDTNTANIALLLLSRQAHQEGFKVMLSGDGADEMFLGYKRYLKGMIVHPYHVFRENYGIEHYIVNLLVFFHLLKKESLRIIVR